MSSKFEVISEIQDVETITVGDGVRERHRLSCSYASGKLTRWRKLKGFAWVRYQSGAVVWVENHWF